MIIDGFKRGVLMLAVTSWLSVGAAEPVKHPNRYASFQQVTNLAIGMSWPRGQALPTFATPAQTLDCIEVQSLSPDERITFSSLQGRVNRKQPRIYLLDARSEEGRDTWADTPTIGLHRRNLYTRSNKFELVKKYAGEVKGFILYDPTRSPHYRNLAGTVAALRQALPVTPDTRQRLQENGIDLDVMVDLTALTNTSPLEIYEHLHQRYWPECGKRLILSARPEDRGDLHHTRDMAAACGAAVVWLNSRIPAERELLRKFFGDMTAGEAVALGWYSSERSGITTASEFGVGTLPADFYLNSTVYSGCDHHIAIPKVPRLPTLTNKVYVAVFLSDGDNIQYAQRAMRRIWDRSAESRGKVALNWTISPGLVDIGPGILNYYYTSATSNDCFVSGPSGMGYMMPFNTLNEAGAAVGICTADPGRMEGYAGLTGTYLERAGLRAVTIWDDATPRQRAAYADRCRFLYGATVQNFKDVPAVQSSVEASRLRFEKLVIPYATTYSHIHRSLAHEIRNWDGAAPKFLAYQVSIWGEMKPDRIVALRDDLEKEFPGKVEFVRADHYFNLYNEAHALPFNLALSSKTVLLAGSSSNTADRVVDGTSTTFWTSAEPGERWLQFDLGEVHTINRYVVRHAGAAGMSRTLNTRAFRVETRTSDSRWQTIDVQTDNRADVTDVDLPPTSGRYIKVTVTDGGADATARIAEVEIFGTKLGPQPTAH